MDEDNQEGQSFDIEAASDQIASDLFGSKTEGDADHEEARENDEPEELNSDSEGEEEGSAQEEPEGADNKEGRPAPASWSKEMHQHFGKLPKDVQDYIELREKQMADGISGAKEDLYFGREMKGAISPYMEIIQSQGLSPAKAVQSLMNVHVALSNGDASQKLDYLKKIANSYGIDISGIERGQSQQAEYPPEIQAVLERLGKVETMYQQTQNAAQQAAYEKSQNEVNSFASNPENAYFDEVADDVVEFIKQGYDLKDAYEKAVWANPVTRQKEMARIQTESEAGRLKKQKEEADKAKKATSVNVRSRDTKKAPTELKGTMEDTMRDTLKAIKARG